MPLQRCVEILAISIDVSSVSRLIALCGKGASAQAWQVRESHPGRRGLRPRIPVSPLHHAPLPRRALAGPSSVHPHARYPGPVRAHGGPALPRGGPARDDARRQARAAGERGRHEVRRRGEVRQGERSAAPRRRMPTTAPVS